MGASVRASVPVCLFLSVVDSFHLTLFSHTLLPSLPNMHLMCVAGELNQVYNIGSTSEIAVADVARDVCALTSRSASETITHVEDRTFQDHRYLIDHENLAALGWQPTISWAAGLRETVAWYRRNRAYWSDIDWALRAHTKLPTPHAAAVAPATSTSTNPIEGALAVPDLASSTATTEATTTATTEATAVTGMDGERLPKAQGPSCHRRDEQPPTKREKVVET